MAVFRIRKPLAGIVGDQVLRSQFLADLVKGRIQLFCRTGVEILSASIARELDQRVLAANVTSGIALDGHDDDAVQNDLGLLRLSHRVLVARFADRIAAVGDDDHHFASAPVQQRVGAR